MMKMKLLTPSLVVLLFFSGISVSHAEFDKKFWSWVISIDRTKEIEPIKDAVYNEECGECHFAYQPGWLPEASWRKLLNASALEDHFGENAELEEDTLSHILDLAVKGSADKSYSKRSRKMMASLDADKAPIKITAVSYIKDKHHEVSEESIGENRPVSSLSLCDECHQKADEGNFDNDMVMIPK